MERSEQAIIPDRFGQFCSILDTSRGAAAVLNKRRKHRGPSGAVWGLVVLAVAIAAAVAVYISDKRAQTSRKDTGPSPQEAGTALPATAPATQPAAGPALAAGPVTFNRDIAPIVHAHCISCHHDRGQAPFALVSYSDVQKRAALIAKVTARRYMPPWLPERGVVQYVGERGLSDEQIALLGRFAEQGAPQGEGVAPRPPPMPATWQLGEPDLVVRMPLTYMLPSSGVDVYRNFVVPISMPESKWVRAVEMLPGSKSVMHHAFVMFDRSGEARRRDARDSELGYPGMNAGEEVSGPPGHFLSWQPGKTALAPPPGLHWQLDKSIDMVLQLHMKPTGKPEPVQPSVAFYFADGPPTRRAFALLLRSVEIDIPAGAKDYAVESTYVLPIDVEATAVLPHVHYRGKQLMAWYELPDGKKDWLLLIKDWDFNWQGDYQFKNPIRLPRGTRVSMRYTFDNSAENPRNPHNPPKAARYGLNTEDEMAELWLQVVTDKPQDYALLYNDYRSKYGVHDEIARAKKMLEISPDNAEWHVALATALIEWGRASAGQEHLEKALSLEPGNAKAHFHLGLLKTRRDDRAGAQAAFEAAVAADPAHYKALGSLGALHMQAGELPKAQEFLIKAIDINPNDPVIHKNLAQVHAAQKNFDKAIESLEKAVKLEPDDPIAREWLERARTAKAGQQ